MVERIDFALEPGVVVFAVFCFVMINVLVAAALYPYLSDDSDVDTMAGDETGDEPPFIEESPPDSEEALEDRIEKFHREISESSDSSG